MLVNKSSVRGINSFANDTEIDQELESAATLNAFRAACISFFLLIFWPPSITKDNRFKILYKTRFKKTQIKFNEEGGFFTCYWFVLGFL